VGEAWLDGLDVIAMTDHIEYLPFRDYFKADLNTSYKIAAQAAEQVGLMVIHGTEITRKQGEIGHFNALFIQDANLVPDPIPTLHQIAIKQDPLFFYPSGWLWIP
jgi:predicted metal-dependent phosphoesterase TrpH